MTVADVKKKHSPQSIQRGLCLIKHLYNNGYISYEKYNRIMKNYSK